MNLRLYFIGLDEHLRVREGVRIPDDFIKNIYSIYLIQQNSQNAI